MHDAESKTQKQVSASQVDSNGLPAKCGVSQVSPLYSSDFREMLYRKRGYTYDTLCSLLFGCFQVLHSSLAPLAQSLLSVRSGHVRDSLTFRAWKKSFHFWRASGQELTLWEKQEPVCSEWPREWDTRVVLPVVSSLSAQWVTVKEQMQERAECQSRL